MFKEITCVDGHHAFFVSYLRYIDIFRVPARIDTANRGNIMTNNSLKKSAGAVVCAVCLLGGAAFAGEITGNGKSLKNEDGTLNGRSVCAFSGREDDPNDPESLFRGIIAQSWGQIPKWIRDTLPDFLHPGVACNPKKSGGGEPG